MSGRLYCAALRSVRRRQTLKTMAGFATIFENGFSCRLYLKKAEVVDVPEPTTCSIVLSETREKLAGVRQAQLETVVPKEERRRVLVVLGRFRGQRAKVLRRDSEAGTVVVQLTADYSAQELSFDEVSEYVGELGEEE